MHFRISLFGRGGVGKSDFLHRLLGSFDPTAEYSCTGGVERTFLVVRSRQGNESNVDTDTIVFIETPGQISSNERGELLYRSGVDGGIIMWEPCGLPDWRRCLTWVELYFNMHKIRKEPVPPFVIVSTKVDDTTTYVNTKHPRRMPCLYWFHKFNEKYARFPDSPFGQMVARALGHVHISVKRDRDVYLPLVLLLKELKGADELEIVGVEPAFPL